MKALPSAFETQETRLSVQLQRHWQGSPYEQFAECFLWWVSQMFSQATLLELTFV
jgi:hypothetical protein